jgi:hypothetical protein
MLYAHFIGYISEVRYTATNKPFVKCLVQTTSGKDIEIRVFGEDNLRELNKYSLIKVTKAEVTAGFWQGFTFYNGTPIGVSKLKFRKPMEFSVANGFDLSSLN